MSYKRKTGFLTCLVTLSRHKTQQLRIGLLLGIILRHLFFYDFAGKIQAVCRVDLFDLADDLTPTGNNLVNIIG